MPIKCLLVEDEPLALERARGFIARLPFLSLEACFGDGIEAMAYLKAHAVDLLFLDVHIGSLSGIELLEALRPNCAVILTTAYDQYALKGYDLRVTDYLLKPYTFERFVQAVSRAQDQLQKTVPPEPEFIFVKTEYRLEKTNIADILFIEGMRDYRRIHTVDKKIMTLQNFSFFEDAIPAKQVCRVHKSYMVNIAKIDSIERDRIRIGDILIPISETYRKVFYELVGKL